MPECTIDAIKIAKAIQKDELSILDGKEFKMSVKIKKRKRMKKTKKTKNQYTLNQIGDALFEFIKTTNGRLDSIDARLDYYGLQIESIQERLDYNGLKKLTKNN